MRFIKAVFPIPSRKLWTYGVPENLSGEARPGVRCRAPFGRQGEMIGYIVEESEKTDIPKEKIKSISAVLDKEPLFSPAILKFANWVADYYLAPLGEVLTIAHPLKFGAKARKVYSITESGRQALAEDKNLREAQKAILAALAEKPSTKRGIEKIIGAEISPSHLLTLVKKGFAVEDSSFIKAREGKFIIQIECLKPAPDDAPKRTKEFLKILEDAGGAVPLREIAPKVPGAYGIAKKLLRQGFVRAVKTRLMRDPLWDKPAKEFLSVMLTVHQKKAFETILPFVKKKIFQPVLLHGVTGSGKTEIYIRLMRETLAMGRRALYLVPEIALTPLAVARLKANFKPKSSAEKSRLAILHSGLGEGERYDEWDRVRKGEADLVVGTRSAIFAPMENIGLIIVDEEHDTSYKQEKSPYYNARDLALVRAKNESAVAILGSATPSAESFANARGKLAPKKTPYLYLTLPERVKRQPLPEVFIVDMAQEFKEIGVRIPFSRLLKSELKKCLVKGHQAMLLLNRRGYAPIVLCRECGYVPECPHCSVTLTFHKGRNNFLMCHYCGTRAQVFKNCPQCKGEFLQMIGWGTEQIEDLVKKEFSDAKTIRLDRDTATHKDAYYHILDTFEKGDANVLIGTQMIAKGHDFPHVTLVGVISADTGLGFPDFRAAERTFQLISQVSGRAGRADEPGKVILQTHNPRHYAIEFASTHSIEDFYEKELWFRKVMKYPPFFSMAVILVRNKNDEKAQKTVRKIYTALTADKNPFVAVLGPAPAPFAKIKDVFRYQIILKSKNRTQLKNLINKVFSSLKRLPKDSVKPNIDPVNVL